MSSFLRTQWDRVAAWALTGAGLVLLAVGWVRVSGTAFPAQQIPYLASAGLGALFLLGVAGTLWLSADLRDEYAKLDEIARSLQARDLPADLGTQDIDPLPEDVPVQPAPRAAPPRQRAVAAAGARVADVEQAPRARASRARRA